MFPPGNGRGMKGCSARGTDSPENVSGGFAGRYGRRPGSVAGVALQGGFRSDFAGQGTAF